MQWSWSIESMFCVSCFFALFYFQCVTVPSEFVRSTSQFLTLCLNDKKNSAAKMNMSNTSTLKRFFNFNMYKHAIILYTKFLFFFTNNSHTCLILTAITHWIKNISLIISLSDTTSVTARDIESVTHSFVMNKMARNVVLIRSNLTFLEAR